MDIPQIDRINTRVLVTGGAGYLGSILCERLLARPYAVTVLDNLTYGQHSLFHLCVNPRFEFIFGDVRDETLVRRLVQEADVLIPLAAIVGAPACDRDPFLACGRVEVAANARIVEFAEKKESAGPDWINPGIYFLSQKVAQPIPQMASVQFEGDVFPRCVHRGIDGYSIFGSLVENGTPVHFGVAESFFQ